MIVPDTWKRSTRAQHEASRPPAKRQRTTSGRGAAHAASTAAAAATAACCSEDVVETIRNTVSNTRALAAENEVFQIECILSALPYRKIIEDVFENTEAGTAGPPEVALVTRAYEEMYMREVQAAHEHPCAMGANCECMHIDRANRFVGVEFLLPGETHSPEKPRMCVLCNRQLTQKLFFDLIFDGHSFTLPIQKYGNICNQPGEYAREVMLMCPPGGPVHIMPYPVVSHQRNRYSVTTRHGVRCLRQHRVSPEDYASGESDGSIFRIFDIDFAESDWEGTQQQVAAAAAASEARHVFSAYAPLNAELCALHARLLQGDAKAQIRIDGYIITELLLRSPDTRARLQAALEPDTPLHSALNFPLSQSMRVENLPDLGAYIRFVVYFSGNTPLVTQLPNLLVYTLVYEALPNIKRTKQVRHCDASRSPPIMSAALCSACIGVIPGTLLGLYAHAAKRPGFQVRCDMMAQIHAAQTLPVAEKLAWLLRVPNLTRLAFMEYVAWFITEYMPVEAEIIARRQSTPLFLRTYRSVCDSFRQTCAELAHEGVELTLKQLDTAAAQHIDRCMRICKFKMFRHAAACDSYALDVHSIDPADIQRVLALPVLAIACSSNGTHCKKGRGGRCRDVTDELRVLRPDAPAPMLRLWGFMHQLVHTALLPRDFATAQLSALQRRFRNCELRARSARSVYLCMTCCLRRRALGAQKFRLCIPTGRLECTACGPAGAILCVDGVGRVLYYGSDAFFLCLRCARLCTYTDGSRGLAVPCARCAPPAASAAATANSARATCLCCESANVYHTARLLDASQGTMRTVHLCFKHTPGARARASAIEVSQLAALARRFASAAE